MRLTKVISGGQTGADLAGLKSAKAHGIPTGGWMPKGFLAQDRLHPEYAEMYGMRETQESHYPPRTALNVKESDGTLRFAGDWESRGEKLTKQMTIQYHKPEMPVTVGSCVLEGWDRVIAWIKENKIQVLNIAGNSEETWPGIGLSVECWLDSLFDKLESEDPLS